MLRWSGIDPRPLARVITRRKGSEARVRFPSEDPRLQLRAGGDEALDTLPRLCALPPPSDAASRRLIKRP